MKAQERTPDTSKPPGLSSLCLTIIEHAPLPMATLEGRSHIVRYVNPAFCRLLEKPIEQLVGKSFCDLVSEKEACLTLLDRVLRTGTPANHTEQRASEPQSVFWSYTMWPAIAGARPIGVMIQVTETAVSLEKMQAMNAALMLGSVHQHELTEASDNLNAQLRKEIDERKRAEEARRESEERYRSLFASAPMAVFACDRNAVIQHYNRRAVELWGREPVCGVEQHCGSVRLWLPDGLLLPHAQSPMVEVLRTGIPALNVEVCIERPDGSRVPVLVNFAALKNAQGKITGAITSFIDITGRKQAEEAVRKAGERFHFMAESMPQKIFTARPNGDVDYFNQQWTEFTGLSFEQIKDWGWTQFIHPDDVEENVRRWQQSIDTGEPFEFQHRFRRADGMYRWHLSRVFPMRDAEGAVMMWIGSNTDIDDQKGIEQALRESEARARIHFESAEASRLSAEAAKARAEAATRAKDDFLAALSHELRTPLSPALLLATSLADDIALLPRVRADADVIAKGIALQAQLVDDLLDLTRITGGKLRLDLQPIDAHLALRQTLEILRADVRERQLEVTLDLAAPHDCIKADAVRVQQIFWNVLKNAVKFTPPGGAITVRTRNPPEKEGMLEVEISDTGVGIEPEMLEKVFDTFIQEEHDDVHRFGGIGLGLAITRRLVEVQNGRISVESTGRNRGATFHIELPLEAPELCASLEPPPVAAGATPPAKPRRILLVEDHEQTRSTLVRLLERRGHRVAAVATAAGAREIAAEGGVDLVISDLGLPDGDGHLLMAGLRDEHGLSGIALSGYGMDEDLALSRISGFFTHLIKPVDIHALEAAIAAAPPPRSALDAPESN